MISRDELIRQACNDVIAEFLSSNQKPSAAELRHILYNRIFEFIERENVNRGKGRSRLPLPEALPNYAVACAIAFLEEIRIIDLAASTRDKNNGLYIYNRTSGLYELCSKSRGDTLMRLAMQYRTNIGAKDAAEIISYLRVMSEVVTETKDPNLLFVGNGIFNLTTKKLQQFSPDYVSVKKIKTCYDENAKNVVIHNDRDGTDWDFDSWFNGLSDDPEVIKLLWQVIAASTRTNVRWGKAIFLYSEVGNNGKGTLCRLIRNLLGDENVACIAINEFSQPYMLSQLIGATAVICDEVDVAAYSEKNAVFKSVVTADAVQINVKYEDPVTVEFNGIVIECLNGFPKSADKSGSFYRRCLFIPFDKNYSVGERKYIKSDYIQRPEVLQYVLKKAIEIPYFEEFDEPEVCKKLLEEYKQENDSVICFLEDILPEMQWDLLPYKLLGSLYQKWYLEANPAGRVAGIESVSRRIRSIIRDGRFPEWTITKECPLDAGKYMVGIDPVVRRYELKQWYCPKDNHKNYRGIARISALEEREL